MTGRWRSAVPSREEQHALKRRAVVTEAGRAFGRFGFHNTSLDDVARALHISKPTFYRYFKNKQALLFECHTLALDLGEESVAFAQRNGATGLDKVLLMIRHYVAVYASELGAVGIVTDFHALAPEHRRIVQKRRDRFDRILRGFVSEGIADGSIPPCDPRMVVSCFMGAINWVPVWFSSAGPRSGEELAEAFARIFATGLQSATADAGKALSMTLAPAPSPPDPAGRTAHGPR